MGDFTRPTFREMWFIECSYNDQLKYTEVVFVCIIVGNGLMIEIYGFVHSLRPFLAYAVHGAILTENSEDRR